MNSIMPKYIIVNNGRLIDGTLRKSMIDGYRPGAILSVL